MALDITNYLSTMPGYGNVFGTLTGQSGYTPQAAQQTLYDTYTSNINQGLDPQHAWQGAYQVYNPGQASPYAPRPGLGMYGAIGGLDPKIAPLAAAYQQQADLANQANESRYAQINQGYGNIFGNMMADQSAGASALLSGYQDRYGRVMGGLSGLGESARLDIADQYRRAQSQSLQSLMSRGLGNTTVADAMRRGLIRDETRSYMALDEQLRREALGYDVSLSGDYLNALQGTTAQRLGLYQVPLQQLQFQSARQDVGPDPSSLVSLAQGLGAQSQAKKQMILQALLGTGAVGASLLGAPNPSKSILGQGFAGLGSLFGSGA